MATKIPSFSYTGTYSTEIKNGYWYIYLKSSGTLKFTYAKTLEACIVGGGAAGQGRSAANTGLATYGGGGGTVLNKTGISASAGTGYSIVIGSGGKKGLSSTNGSASTAFGYSASGGSTELKYGKVGKTGSYAFNDSSLSRYGGGGGRGGGSPGGSGYSGGAGGGGKGAGGGNYGGGGASAVAGTTNTGGGGGGYGADLNWKDDDGYNWSGGGDNADGGSGIVILRGTQDDSLPININGTQISQLIYNGTTIQHLIYNGQQLY